MYISHDWAPDERLRVIRQLSVKIENSADIDEIRECAHLVWYLTGSDARTCNLNREKIFHMIGQEDKARKPKIAPETRDALGAIQEIAARVLEDAPDTIAGPIDEIRRLAEGATSK